MAKEIENDFDLCLGIDLGTTSVKICLVSRENGEILQSVSRKSHADVPSNIGHEGSEQEPYKIIHTLVECLESIELQKRKCIQSVSITGQMHGVMLWTKKSLKDQFYQQFSQLRGDNLNISTSHLYTWQDQRCSAEFLASLPKPDSHLPLASGHGCATMLWLHKHSPSFLSGFDCCGTVMDYLVAGLCGLEKPVTSVQLTASWGYFSTVEKSWNYSQLTECGLPVSVLPYVVSPGHVAGSLQSDWCGISKGTPVLAALGDVQCAVYSVLRSPQDAVLNMSTSCQLSFSVREELVPLKADSSCPVQYFPYFDEMCLAIAASLNGGNVLAHFVTMLQQWMQTFGINIEENQIWQQLLETSVNIQDTNGLKIIPTLFGERHSPSQRASISGLNKDNLDLGAIFRSLCSGLLSNLSSMMSVSFLEEHDITHLIGSGSLLARNEVMKQEVAKHYGTLNVEFGNSCDSATGAALYAIKHLKL